MNIPEDLLWKEENKDDLVNQLVVNGESKANALANIENAIKNKTILPNEPTIDIYSEFL